ALIGAAPHHAGIKAPSLYVFLYLTMRNLAWPADAIPLLAPLLWLPWIVYSAAHRGREPISRFLLMLGLWTALTSAALSYGRSGAIPPRYHDLLSPGLIANGFALVALARNRAVVALALPWVLIAGFGFRDQIHFALQEDLPERLVRPRIQEANVARFVRSGDRRALYDQPDGAIPFPSASMLDGFLRSQRLRAMLPPVVRPLDAPLPSPHAGWLSAITEAVLPRAWLLALAAAIALAVSAVRARARGGSP
ncbi:MAG: hypothetical protein U0Q16_36115, partial [Bryobacteraceae bacterium]